MTDTERKRLKEKKMVEQMISVYCKEHHSTKRHLCSDCEQLKNYAFAKIDRCPFMETKTFCSSCKVHCYNREMANKIKEVMRYSGPRMLIYNPKAAVSHMIDSLKNRKGS